MRKMLILLLLGFSMSANAQVLSLRDQAVVIDEILAERINTLLP